MAHITADRVFETSTTTGTADLSLAGAITGYRAFSSVCSNSDTFYYSLWEVDGSGAPSGAWETGLGTFNTGPTLERTTVHSSSTGSKINLASGTKRVAIGLTAEFAGALVSGQVSSVDNEVVLFSGTTGKIIKRATTTGLLKASSGVLAAAVAGTDYVTPSGTETLDNKTLIEFTETPYTVTGTTPALSAANGTIQLWTLSASSTPTDGLNNGQSIIIGIDDGSAFSITWPPITWTTTPAIAPTLLTTGYTWVTLWKVADYLYGRY